MKGFWNDADGITVIDILALVVGFIACYTYVRYKVMDTNFADICVGALLSVAGQRIGVTFSRNRFRSNSYNDYDYPDYGYQDYRDYSTYGDDNIPTI